MGKEIKLGHGHLICLPPGSPHPPPPPKLDFLLHPVLYRPPCLGLRLLSSSLGWSGGWAGLWGPEVVWDLVGGAVWLAGRDGALEAPCSESSLFEIL